MDMTAAIGFEEFKRQADIIHHNRFEYDPSRYTKTRGSIKFFDSVTNDNYEQRIVNHLKGSFPRELQKKNLLINLNLNLLLMLFLYIMGFILMAMLNMLITKLRF